MQKKGLLLLTVVVAFSLLEKRSAIWLAVVALSLLETRSKKAMQQTKHRASRNYSHPPIPHTTFPAGMITCEKYCATVRWQGTHVNKSVPYYRVGEPITT